MSSELTNPGSSSDLTLEIAHVLFLDVVAYSRLPMEQQAQVLRQLQDLVKETNESVARRSGRNGSYLAVWRGNV